MRFLFVTSGPHVPTTRFRVMPYLPFLRRVGHRCDVVHSFPEKYEYLPQIGWRLSQRLKRSVRLWHAWLARWRRYDAIFIEREVFDDDTSDLEARFRQVTDRLVLDVDDAIFLRHPDKFDRIVALSDVVIAGNQRIADYVASHSTSRTWPLQIEQIPTCVCLDDYQVASDSNRQCGKPVVGWIGTSYNVAFLKEASWGLREAAKEIDFKLLIVSGNSDHLPREELTGVDYEFRTWKPDRDNVDLQEMDIGLMPLPKDDPWMQYKCGFKLIQYLATGVPGIASPVGVNVDILQGETAGRLANTNEQWRSSLVELLSSPELRHKCGQAGRKIVEQRYTIEAHWPSLERILTGEASVEELKIGLTTETQRHREGI